MMGYWLGMMMRGGVSQLTISFVENKLINEN